MENLKEQIKNLMDASKYHEAVDLLLSNLGVKIDKKWLKYDYNIMDKEVKRDIFKIKISRNSRSYSFQFGQAIYAKDKQPTNFDIVVNLQKCDVGNFNDFCDIYGRNNDSIKAYKTYKRVKKEYETLKLLFSDEELELMQEII